MFLVGKRSWWPYNLFSSCWKVEEGMKGLNEHHQCGGGKLSDFCGSTKHKCGKPRIMSPLIQSLYCVAVVFVKSPTGFTFFCLVFTFCNCLETQCYVQTTTCLVHLSDDLLSATWTVNNNGREELRFSDGASEKGKHLHSSMYVSSVFVSDWWWMPCHITPFYSSLHLNFASSRSLDCSPSHHSSLESSKPKPLILYCILWTWTGDFLQSKFVPKVACFCSEEQWLGWGEDGPGLWQIL